MYVSGGFLVIDSGLGDTAEINFGLTWPTANADGSWMFDLWSFGISVGTSAGTSNIVNWLDTYSTGLIKLPTRIRVRGLTTGQKYYPRARAIDEPGNQGADSDAVEIIAAVWTPPTRSFQSVPGNKTFTSPGDYIITADTTGPLQVSANGVYLWGNGQKKITHTSANGLEVDANVNTLVVDDVNFDHPSGNGHNISIAGNLGAGCVFMGSKFELRNNAGLTSNGTLRNLNGAQFIANILENRYNDAANPNEFVALVSYCTNFVAFDNDPTCISSANRSGFIGMCGTYESFANRWTTQGTCLAAMCHSSFGMPSPIIHDEIWTPGANSGTQRICHVDGSDNAGDYTPIDTIQAIIRHITADMRASGMSGPAIRLRNPGGPHTVGGLIALGASTDAPAISFGDNDDGQGGTHTGDTPYGSVLFRNQVIGGSGRPFLQYGPWRNKLLTWRNDLLGQSGGDGAGDWQSNQDNFPNGIAKVGSALWDAYALSSPSTTGFTLSGAWVGPNPLSDIPQKMAAPFAVTRYR